MNEKLGKMRFKPVLNNRLICMTKTFIFAPLLKS